jgi:hypothetical protein
VVWTTVFVRMPFVVEKSAEAVVPAGIVDRWEGLNAKLSVSTFVLAGVALTAVNPVRGLAGRV